MLKREEIRIRDPFIYTDVENKCYYMYGTTSLVEDKFVARNTFSVYRTLDLENFEEPKVIFDGSKHGFWADRDFGRQSCINITESTTFSVAVRQRTSTVRRIFLYAILPTENLFRLQRIPQLH